MCQQVWKPPSIWYSTQIKVANNGWKVPYRRLEAKLCGVKLCSLEGHAEHAELMPQLRTGRQIQQPCLVAVFLLHTHQSCHVAQAHMARHLHAGSVCSQSGKADFSTGM